MRRSVLAWLIALPAVPWLFEASSQACKSALGRDQGIFQYVAWAISEGEKLYRDVRDVNGPLVALVHLFLLKLGGDATFRALDVAFSFFAFAFAGACLPSLAKRAASIGERVAWGAAAATVLLAQYLTYGFWDTAQRESFFDWFLAVALGALVVARDRRMTAWLFLAGACSCAPLFGKPTFLLFTLSHLVVVGWDRRRLATFAAGMATTAIVMFAFVATYGDLASWMRIALHDVPTMYRFIWPRSVHALLTMPVYSTIAATAAITSFAGIALVATRRAPRPMFAIAVVPIAGLVSMLAQAKGFPYHFHPVTFGVPLVGLALVVVLAERLPRIAYAFALFFAVRAALNARTALMYETWERDADYVRVDYFPEDLRAVAHWLSENTAPDDRVQTYAMDPYVLFLARRKSASPYVYAYDLNVDAALRGSFDDDGPRPTDTEKQRIEDIRTEHESDLVARLERSPPKAFVFIDKSPLMSFEEAEPDFEKHCPTAATFLRAYYEEAAVFGGMQVWSRVDPR